MLSKQYFHGSQLISPFNGSGRAEGRLVICCGELVFAVTAPVDPADYAKCSDACCGTISPRTLTVTLNTHSLSMHRTMVLIYKTYSNDLTG